MSVTGYELIASGRGQRLERWNNRVVIRPETAARWNWPEGKAKLPEWDGLYHGSAAAGGHWEWRNPLPMPCVVRAGNLSFSIKPTASKHLGLFPEQSENWAWISSRLSSVDRSKKAPPRILNLFGYTGGSTLAAASAGAAVTHVDSSKAMVSWCSENARLSGLDSCPIRYIVEDALTFLHREIRRGNRYDAVMMDPPSYGRGKSGELWKLSEHLSTLMEAVHQVMSNSPLFLMLNIYSESIGNLSEERIIGALSLDGGEQEQTQLGLTGTLDDKWLPCGTCYRWSR